MKFTQLIAGRFAPQFGVRHCNGFAPHYNRVDEGRVNGHGESAKALVIGIMPMVDPGLVSNLIIFVFLLCGNFGGDGV